MVSDWGRLATQTTHQLPKCLSSAECETTSKGGLEIEQPAAGDGPRSSSSPTPVFCCSQRQTPAADVTGSANHGTLAVNSDQSKQRGVDSQTCWKSPSRMGVFASLLKRSIPAWWSESAGTWRDQSSCEDDRGEPPKCVMAMSVSGPAFHGVLQPFESPSWKPRHSPVSSKESM